MVDFWCRSFSRFMQSFSRFIRDVNGEKTSRYLMIFFTVSFSRFAPSRSEVRDSENGDSENGQIHAPLNSDTL